MRAMQAIESLLFVAGDQGLDLEELAQLLDLSIDQTRYALLKLAEKYQADQQSALKLSWVNQCIQLVTKSELADVVKSYALSPFSVKLSQAALETLAIIAYQAPITRMEIDDIRGVQSSAMIQKLLQHDLIEEQGRKEGPGRPIIYGVSDYFYQYFGLSSLDELPDLTRLKTEETEEAEQTALFDAGELADDSVEI
ncbi:SMC-Scp complex subunit ScpB [Aerococcus sp. UMB7834]|uniref:SMC-Scp complex subunit ScpB n=1 Tax=Aerococcus sp. UMB7834 TaxID=3046342 RepID=UPI00254FE28E|nr:SMC-Scp complex subunit ScpB [Aerococcus sp. UMB7834]MDK6804599.1 SMC-Scp complex subunit ScpB [Aerococcus sp. UMB7834]